MREISKFLPFSFKLMEEIHTVQSDSNNLSKYIIFIFFINFMNKSLTIELWDYRAVGLSIRTSSQKQPFPYGGKKLCNECAVVNTDTRREKNTKVQRISSENHPK